MRDDKITRFIKIALDTAKVAEEGEEPYLDKVGYGKRSYAINIRNGVKAVIDLQEENARLKEKIEILQADVSEFKLFFKNTIDEYDIEALSDDDMDKINEFIKNLLEQDETQE